MVVIHHTGQKSIGPLAEVTTKYHDKRNVTAFDALHGQHNGNKHPEYPVKHDSRWDADRSNYWKWRATNVK